MSRSREHYCFWAPALWPLWRNSLWTAKKPKWKHNQSTPYKNHTVVKQLNPQRKMPTVCPYQLNGFRSDIRFKRCMLPCNCSGYQLKPEVNRTSSMMSSYCSSFKIRMLGFFSSWSHSTAKSLDHFCGPQIDQGAKPEMKY